MLFIHIFFLNKDYHDAKKKKELHNHKIYFKENHYMKFYEKKLSLDWELRQRLLEALFIFLEILSFCIVVASSWCCWFAKELDTLLLNFSKTNPKCKNVHPFFVEKILKRISVWTWSLPSSCVSLLNIIINFHNPSPIISIHSINWILIHKYTHTHKHEHTLKCLFSLIYFLVFLFSLLFGVWYQESCLNWNLFWKNFS